VLFAGNFAGTKQVRAGKKKSCLERSRFVNVWSEMKIPVIAKKRREHCMVKTAAFILILCASTAFAQMQAESKKQPPATGQKRNTIVPESAGPDQKIKNLKAIIEKQQKVINSLEARIKELENENETKHN
jgi:hypothetical protein